MATTEPNRKPLLSLQLSFEPREEQIPMVRRMLHDLSAPIVNDADALERLLMAAHELLENLVKYGSLGGCEFLFELGRDGGGSWVVIRTSNRASPDHLSDIRERLKVLHSASDPVAYYDAVIRDSAKREHGSGLGLARIHAEGGLTLEYGIDDERVTLTAHGPLEARSPV